MVIRPPDPASLFTDFVAAIRERRRPACPLPDGLLVDRVLTLAYAAAEQGRELSLPAAAAPLKKDLSEIQ
jgi:hypothetical protein